MRSYLRARGPSRSAPGIGQTVNVMHCVGARPNFMKMAPVMRALEQRADIDQVLVNTGQHYDEAMAQIFFDELGLPTPDVDFGVGSLPRPAQIAAVRAAMGGLIPDIRPDLMVVYGDVNSTLGCALAASDADVPLSHVEAGLRSFDEAMPEEKNRVETDRLATTWFTHSPEAEQNLAAEGLGPDGVHLVGNTMIDTLVRLLPLTDDRMVPMKPDEPFALATFHRPSNVDTAGDLAVIFESLGEIGQQLPVLWPVHPRVRGRLPGPPPGVTLLEPLGYLDFLTLERSAAIVLTDSGGVQEETTFLGVPCLTVRENTERPVTVTHGTNRLVKRSAKAIRRAAEVALAEGRPRVSPPDLWDGHAAERIAALV